MLVDITHGYRVCTVRTAENVIAGVVASLAHYSSKMLLEIPLRSTGSATEDMALENLWFQLDGATCHTAHPTIDLLRPP